MANENQTIIIKKIKKGGHGHHGGAWKVAYADFVTAMMAFFLLMWLLASSSEDQKKGLAEYFTPTQGLKGEMGIGFAGGQSSTTEEGTALNDSSVPGMVSGQPEQGVTEQTDADSLVEGELESQIFETAKEEIKAALEENEALEQYKDNVMMTQTPEGLKIELRDSDDTAMFVSGGQGLSKAGKSILIAMIPVIRKLPNHLSLIGHTDAQPFAGTRKDYSNWELSTDRALATRRFMEANEVLKERVKKITGRASEEPVLKDDRTAAVNRRIEIILLRGSHLSLLPQNQAASRDLLTTPSAKNTLRKRKEKLENSGEEAVKSQNPISGNENTYGAETNANIPAQSEAPVIEEENP